MYKSIAFVAVLAGLAAILLSGCDPRVEFPPHKNGYNMGVLTGGGGIIYINQTNNIAMDSYPHLKLRQGFTIKRAVERLVGGDALGYVIAIHTATNRGFAVEAMNGAQGGFLFAPLNNADEALDYARFMFHEPPTSGYSRDHINIEKQQDFDAALSGWKDKYKIIKKTPTDITRVTQ